MHDPLIDELAALLLSRLEVTLADDKTFASAPRLPAHAPTTRLILITAGRLRYQLGSQQLALKTGDALLVPAWSVRRWSLHPGEKCRLTWCEFIVRPSPPTGLPAVQTVFNADLDPPCIRRIANAFSDHNHLLAEAELKSLLARAFTAATVIQAPISTRTAGARTAETAIESTLSWLHQHYTETFSLDDLARKADLSPRQFRQQFAALVGTPPRQYLTSLRMYDAKFRLRSTNQSVKQVALAVGYTDPLYFSRHYKQYWGHAPGKRNTAE